MSNRERTLPRRSFVAAAGSLVGSTMLGGTHIVVGSPQSPNGELTWLSATRLAQMIREKNVSSSEVVGAYLGRIREIEGKINAVTYLARDEAIAQARLADEAITQGKVDWATQPLFGVPVSFKDNLETRWMRTTAGSPALSRNVPSKDATVVQRMKAAGAIVLAKTNLPLFGMAFDTSNLVHGQTNNPYDLSRVPGGSSGGEAALIAAGGSPLGIGNDSSGSIRVPSHFCGIAGLCPSWGRVSTAGCIPSQPNNGPFYLSIGPMARRVEDLRTTLPIIAGRDVDDPFTFPLPLPGQDIHNIEGLRVAFFTDARNIRPVDAIKAIVEAAAQALARRGCKVVNRRPPLYNQDNAHELIGAIVEEEFTAHVPELLKENGAEEDRLMTEIVQRLPVLLQKMPRERLAFLKSQGPVVQRELHAFMKDFDVLLCPVCTHPAMKHGTVWDHVFEGAVVFTEPLSLDGSLPKGVVRCGTTEGLPIGVQVVGAPWRDDLVLDVLSTLEDEFGGWQPPPSFAEHSP